MCHKQSSIETTQPTDKLQINDKTSKRNQAEAVKVHADVLI